MINMDFCDSLNLCYTSTLSNTSFMPGVKNLSHNIDLILTLHYLLVFFDPFSLSSLRFDFCPLEKNP